MRDTQRKGDFAKAAAIAYFASLDYEVGFLLTESAPYDLFVDTGESVKRVQVKYTKNDRVDLRRIHSNAQGYVVKTYDENDFDWLFVYKPDGSFYLIEDAAGRKYVSLGKVAGVWFNGPLLKSEGGDEPSKSSNLLPSSINWNIHD